jgi:uncharacterized protein YndB with AHSA1/START domain
MYTEIIPRQKLAFITSFSNAEGEITRNPMIANFPAQILNIVTFSEHEGKTTMSITGHPVNASDEERNLYESYRQGMQQGFKGSLDKLEEELNRMIQTLN